MSNRLTAPVVNAPSEEVPNIGRISAVIIYFVVFAAAMTAGMTAFRIGLGSSILPGISALAALGFTLAVPVALLSLMLKRQPSLEILAGPLMAVGMIVFFGLSYFGAVGLWLTLAAAIAACARLGWLARGHGGTRCWLVLLGFVLVFLLCFVGLAGTRYASFVADFLALGGRASGDVYYHWSITNALRYFGSVAIGVDGLNPVKYYPLSHFAAARVAEMAGSGTSLAFIFARAVFLVPLCLAAWSLAALNFDRQRRMGPAMVATLFCLVMVLVQSMGNALADDFFDSESHVLGLAILGLVLPAALHAMRPAANLRADIILWALLIGCLALATAAKVTTGFIILVLLGYVALRGQYKRPVFMVALWVLSAAIAYLIYRQVISSDSVGTLDASIAANFGLDEEWYYPVLKYSLAMLAVFVLVATRPAGTGTWAELRAGRLPLLEILGVVVIACTLPLLFLPMPAGSHFYVIHPQVWVGIAIVVAIGCPWVAAEAAAIRQPGWRRRLLVGATAILVIVMLREPVPDFVMDRWSRMIAQSSFVRTGDPSFYLSRKKKPVRDGMKRSLPLLTTATYYWPEPRSFVVGGLAAELAALRATHDVQLAAYVSPKADDFWSLTDNCFIQPMMLFGMTAVPLIDGLPPLSTGCGQQQTISYGFSTLPVRTSDDPLDDAALCALAAQRGFSVVARIESLAQVDRVLTCTP